MAIIKCKMCGGDLIIEPGSTVAECEFCGSKQTIPNQDNDKKLTLFARANRLRMGSEFDKAAGIYESIVADFPEEAEAYWGLVLCKYGIEYVDDPASGKKIPTCHRSSFDSVMDDRDFEQACENADGAARKVYRDEAKAIEEIRKGIIEVSGKEDPYDIFICYKETAENGDRTIDSVIAQDVYDALTAKGYRVFFSRITLEDKLGQEYEPYIFAALNSAKIMLAFGTDYEYYNAVWVKNEWSRYLKLMAKDKSKHLIPCYKNIDAYDMPKEFAKLQAQDMGKVGAMQDLLRGIEKILPKAAPVIQPVLTHQSAMAQREIGNKLSNLLERGNIALEDGNWAKAENFYEDALNNDAHSAEGYIGLLLSKEKCRTLDAFIRKRKDKTEAVNSRTLKLAADTTHIEEVAERHAIPGYLEKGTVAALYDFDLSYSSAVANREQQKAEEAAFWQNQPQLHRAEQYAQGQIAEVIQRAKDDLFGTMNARIKTAQQEEANALQLVKRNYVDHIRQADEKAVQLHNDAEAQRESDYQSWLQIAKTETNVAVLKDTAGKFAALGTYKDSANLAKHCHARAEEEQAKLDAAKAAKEKADAQEAAARSKKNKTIAGIAATIAVVVITAAIVVTKVIIPNSHYNAAIALMNDGKYEEAIAAFEAMAGYKNSNDRILECHYLTATALMNDGKYEEAIVIFETLDEFGDSREQISVCQMAQNEIDYNVAIDLMDGNDYSNAIVVFKALNGYKDSNEQISACQIALNDIAYDKASALLDSGNYKEAISAFEKLIGYKNANEQFGKCCYLYAEILQDSNPRYAAIMFAKAGNYQNAIILSKQLWDQYAERNTVSAGGTHTVGLKSDGTVIAAGSNSKGQCDVSEWKDIIAVSAGMTHTVGLKSDGTVIATGSNSKGQCNVSEWDDIVAISAAGDHTIGLKADGTVVAVGRNDDYECNVNGWHDVVAISASKSDQTVGIRADGFVNAIGYVGGLSDIRGWTGIIAISAGGGHTVGLKSDGSVVANGTNLWGECNVNGWRDIVAISAGRDHTIGLKSNGTVVGVGWNNDGQCNLRGGNFVAVSAGASHTVGLKSDGTVVAAGPNYCGECNVSCWEDIKLP